MYLEAVRSKPSCETRVLVEAVGLEKRVAPLLGAVGLEERLAPKLSRDTLVLLEAIWPEGRGAAKPSCDVFGVLRAIPDNKLDLDSELELREVPQPSSEQLDAVEMVAWSFTFRNGLDARAAPRRPDKLEVPIDATERGLLGLS
jgi:hypothetical protein